MLAKMVSTLDIVSNGRVFLGVGAGWLQREFEAYSQWDPPSIRVSKTEEGLRLILELWTEDKVDFQGKFYQSKGGILQPKPVHKPHPPLLFGGFSPKMLSLAGRYGDIVFIPPWNKLSFEEARAMVMDAAEHSPRVDRPSFAAGAPQADHGSQKYDREQVRRAVREMGKKGCEYFVLFLDSSELLEAMEDFGQHVVPSFS
jgi:alkanesulfonate monooxygenase SsuD/methylene tetrahydromethanopterin reductase-like flavin-dependent oxidoreductase (luciferase family)